MANVSSEMWSSDAKISMPKPTTEAILVDFGGFGFTKYGIAHNLTQTERDDYMHPHYGPPPGSDTSGAISNG